jgi:hypothetical protein
MSPDSDIDRSHFDAVCGNTVDGQMGAVEHRDIHL